LAKDRRCGLGLRVHTGHELLPCGCEVWVRRRGDSHDWAHVAHCAAGRECPEWEPALKRLKGAEG